MVVEGIKVQGKSSSDDPTPLGEEQPMVEDANANLNGELYESSTSPQLQKGSSETTISDSSNASKWRRICLLLGLLALLWITIRVRAPSKPKVIHTSRYSKEFKFRPAASPIITEVLKDGRTRIRGAEPTIRAGASR